MHDRRRHSGWQRRSSDPTGIPVAARARKSRKRRGQHVDDETRALADALSAQGPAASHSLVAALLHDLDISLQANAKSIEGKQHPDRDSQFCYINE